MKKYQYTGLKIVETATKYVIKKCKNKEEVKKYSEFLNSGTGFAGDTPRFFVYAKDQS